MVTVHERNRLEPRMHAERAQHCANVIAHRLDAQMQLAGDLSCRSALGEHVQHLGLARCEVHM